MSLPATLVRCADHVESSAIYDQKTLFYKHLKQRKGFLLASLKPEERKKIDESQEAKFSFKVHLNISAKFGFLEFSTSADFYEKEICELVLNKNWLLN